MTKIITYCCDRCGGIIEEDEIRYIISCERDGGDGGMDMYEHVTLDGKDLCMECFEELNEFMFNS